jgi:peptide-methionine (S)-S-oxide reductase
MEGLKTATFAAGCFWGVQHYFDQIPGVIQTKAGYIGGHKENPTYQEVCSHTTGHAEAVEVQFDPDLISYATLVKHFFRIHDPTQLNRQGPDIGDNYRSAIFFHDLVQKAEAEAVRDEIQGQYKDPIVTDISLAQGFFPAEDYHQKFTEKNGHGMCPIDYKPLA